MNKSLTRLKMLNQYSEPLLPSSILFQEALGFKPNDWWVYPAEQEI